MVLISLLSSLFPYTTLFRSFNDPQGMCPECHGLGKKMGVLADSFIDLDKSLNEGAVQVPVFATWENAMYQGSGDRKSTRLNSSHLVISYAVFCLKKHTYKPV